MTKLLASYLETFEVRLKLTEQDVGHLLTPREGVMHSYVLESTEGDKKKITDLVSFYSLPSSILKKDSNYTHVNVAYSYYNVGTVNKIAELMKFAIVEAKRLGFDVFNALDIMDNIEFLDELKFAPGDGSLHYYLFNWSLSSRLTPQ